MGLPITGICLRREDAMRQIRKGALKFDAFKAHATFSLNQKLPIGNPELIGEFIASTKRELDAILANESFLHGQRTESMFGALVVSLGTVNFIKQEDEGDCFADADP